VSTAMTATPTAPTAATRPEPGYRSRRCTGGP
jgi:hypothetical protein